ncbi:hypothetical protein ACSFB8_09180 [Enterococcus faecalis]
MYPDDAVSIFDLRVQEAQQKRERIALQTILTAKIPKITAIKSTSTQQLKDAEIAMYDKTQNILPQNLQGGLQGAAATSAQTFFKKIARLHLSSPVKRG